MFVLNTNFGEPNNQTGYSFVTANRKSGSPSGATCFETVDDLGGADGLAGNSLNARSQDSFTNYQFPKGEIIWNADYPGESPDSQCDDGDLGCYEKQTWDKSWYEQVRLETGDYHDVEVPAFEEPYCPCGNDLSPECNPGRENPFNPSRTFDSETELANVV